MKNIILISTLVLTSLSISFANTTPEEKTTLLESSSINVSVDTKNLDLFSIATLTKDNNNLDFETKQEVQFVQVYNDQGIIEFQLPVSSKKIRINKNLFTSGEYKLGFKVEGHNGLYMAQVSLK